MNRPRLSRTQIIVILFVGAGLIFALGGRASLFFHRGAPPASGPAAFRMPVPVIRVARITLPVYREYIGTTEAIRNVTLEALATGYLKRQLVPDGSDVRGGALIYQIDPRYYKASLDQARAALEYSRTNQKRNALMVVHGDVSKDAYQLATSSMHQAASTYLYDKAALESARINLDYTRIKAPFSGRLGKSLVYTGTLIASGTQINTLVQMDPLYVTFNPSEKDLDAIQEGRKRGPVGVEVRPQGSGTTAYKGNLTFLDNAVDRTTGTIVARGTIPNPDFRLVPGEFVEVRVKLGVHPEALAIPQIAVGSSQTGKYVYVVGKGNTVELRMVKLGMTSGDQVEIRQGLREGDLVVVGNLQKIGPGSPVSPLPPQPGKG
jgi:multidrug efflux system membrane fusion protein